MMTVGGLSRIFWALHGQFPVRVTALKDTKPRPQAFIEWLGIKDHVGRQSNGYHPYQGS
jgi:hypothetical protein